MIKKISIYVLTAVIALLPMISSPAVSYAAEGIGTLDVTLDADGGISVGGDGFEANREDAWNNLFVKYKGFIAGVSGVGTITMVALFIMQFMKLAASAGNPQARSQALTGVLWTGIAATGLGAVTVIVGFFYRAL